MDTDELRKKINKKIDSVDVLLAEFNLVVNTKQKLVEKGNELSDEEIDLDTGEFLNQLKKKRD